jgi:hypothetical protein
MKAYLVTTGALFGLLAVLHVWRAIAEWPHGTPDALFVLFMIALVVIPGALCWWALRLLRNSSQGAGKNDDANTGEGSDDSSI